MKASSLCLSLIVFSMMSCITDGSYYGDAPLIDTLAPAIRIIGYKVDTAFLYSTYKDPGAEAVYDADGKTSCTDVNLVRDIENTVNTRIPGIYYIHYKANDSLGYPLPIATRTVHVIENTSTFLNGNYNVTCTCTAQSKSTSQTTVTTGNYTAAINPSNERSAFDLTALEVGNEVLVPFTYLYGNKILVNYFSTNLQHIGDRNGEGIVSPSKNSFTLETTSYPYQPLVTYHCKNVFTKQVSIN